jgi:hypothetical protein
MSDELLEDLKDLKERWEWEYKTYIESEVELERIMSVQQYRDTCKLERLIEKYDE